MNHLIFKPYIPEQSIRIFTAEKPSIILSPEFIGAFSGAFFAFIFGLISYFLIKRHESFIEHRNAIVKLERLLNEHLDLISINQSEIAHIIEILGRPALTANRLVQLRTIDDLSIELKSIDLVNDYFSYERSIQRLNTDFERINHSLVSFENVVIGGRPLHPANTTFLLELVRNFSTHLTRINEECKKLLCLVEAHLSILRKKNNIFFGMFHGDLNFNITSEQLEAERLILENDIARNVAQDQTTAEE